MLLSRSPTTPVLSPVAHPLHMERVLRATHSCADQPPTTCVASSTKSAHPIIQSFIRSSSSTPSKRRPRYPITAPRVPLHSRELLVTFRGGNGRLPTLAASRGRSGAHNVGICAGANSTRPGRLFLLADIEAGHMTRSSALHQRKCIQVSLRYEQTHA
jgi:hypothetical protein